MNQERIAEILAKISYKDWQFKVEENKGALYLQIVWTDADTITGETTLQSSRKWLLSEWMTKSEIVQTAFKAVLTAEEHETREFFKYRGRRIFGPHFDVDALVDVVTAKQFDYRKEQ